MSDRRVLAACAALITAAILLFLIGTYPSWKAAIGKSLSWNNENPATESVSNAVQSAKVPTMPVPSADAMTAPPPAADVPVPAVAPGVPEPAPKPKASLEQPLAQDALPTFDVIRIEPTGESVIAARAKAGASIVLLDGGKPIAQAQADASGQVAFVPPVLSPGEHSLMLSVGEPNSPGALSSQSVAVSVPEQAKAPPMVALIQPDQPTKVLSGADIPQASVADASAGLKTPAVAVRAIDVEEMGSIFATGRATPDSHCRVYLNGSFIAMVTAGKDGSWSLKIQRGMKPGRYVVRVDQVDSAAGQVQARAEVPFEYPTRLGNASSLLRPKHASMADRLVGSGSARVGFASGTGTASGRPFVPAASALPRPADLKLAAADTVGSPGLQSGSDAATTQPPSVAIPVAPPAAAMPTIVAQLLTTKVVHGDSLWRISRKILGKGLRYTQIYAVNTAQIRDPRLIYPGQIFVMPQTTP